MLFKYNSAIIKLYERSYRKQGNNMYEETKIKFDWKGFLLKFAIIILVVILVIKLLPTKQKSHSESFTSNLTKLKDVSINYFQNNNLPEKENDTKVVTLSDLIVSGKISKLQDSKGKECDEENSYIEATKMVMNMK